jgi:hypothetical protein
MFEAVSASSQIPQPDVPSFIGESNGESSPIAIDDEIPGRLKKPVKDIDWRFFPGYPMQLQNITVLSCYRMLLHLQPIHISDLRLIHNSNLENPSKSIKSIPIFLKLLVINLWV